MKNQAYLKDWDDYAAQHKSKSPILLPIILDINSDGEIVRERMRAPDVKALYIKSRKRDFPDYLVDHKDLFDDPDPIFKDYVDYFAPIDGAQGPGVPSPLDLQIIKPTWMLFYLRRNNWTFTKQRQYSVENDRDDLLRNFAKVCTLDDHNVLILSNACLSAPKGLKFNLHVTISQTVHGKPHETDIIIDPGTQNHGGFGGGGGGG